jgi:TolA-binding protein
MTTVPTALVPPRRVWNRRLTVIITAIAVLAALVAATAYLVLDDETGTRTERSSEPSKEAPSVDSIIRAREAETARWEGLAARDARLRARQAEVDRLTGLAEYQGAVVLTQGQRAEAARLTGLAEYQGAVVLTQGQRAEAARLTGLAESRGAIVLTQGQRAEADRLTGLAEYYMEHGGAGAS